jgi:voltage-dependent anion channel protein 2
MTTAKFDVKDLSKVSTSACLGLSGGIVVGGDAAYSLKSSALASYNLGASYTKGPLFAAVKTDDKLSSANLSLMYKVSPVLSVASSTSHSAAKSVSVSAVGASYKASFGDFKAKVCGGGVVSASLVKDIAPKVTLTASGSMVKTDTSTFKYGLGIVM